MYSDALIVFVKNPEPGKVKTRLSPPLTPDQACTLYRNFVLDALAQYTRVLPTTEIYLFYAPADAGQKIRLLVQNELSKIAGRFRFYPQTGEDLGDRMSNAFGALFERRHRRVVIIGSDHPGLPSDFLIEAFARLDGNDVTIGPSLDGGYYLLGLKEAQAQIFRGIRWSSPEVLDATLAVMRKLRKTVHQLPKWYDVDDIADLRRLRDDFKTERIKKEAPNSYRFVTALSEELHHVFKN